MADETHKLFLCHSVRAFYGRSESQRGDRRRTLCRRGCKDETRGRKEWILHGSRAARSTVCVRFSGDSSPVARRGAADLRAHARTTRLPNSRPRCVLATTALTYSLYKIAPTPFALTRPRHSSMSFQPQNSFVTPTYSAQLAHHPTAQMLHRTPSGAQRKIKQRRDER